MNSSYGMTKFSLRGLDEGNKSLYTDIIRNSYWIWIFIKQN